nr:cation:proton antiporter [uncultured Desulfobacter sp.]
MNNLILILQDFREVIGHHGLFTVGLLLIVGYLLGKAVSLIKIPEITGYIIAGLLMGDALTGIVHHEMSEDLKIVTDVALGLIALTIGGEFYMAKLKKMGREVVIITIFQIIITFATVSISLLVFKLSFPFAILMGAIATATAPAATVNIVQSLRAQGKFVDYLYGVVALDDAGCVIIFGLSFAVAAGMLNPGALDHGPAILVLYAFSEIFSSLLLGAITGYLVHCFCTKKTKTNEILILTLGFIFLETAAAIVFHLSPLLSNMAAGALLINLSPRNNKVFRILDPMSPPIYALFFVIAGTELDPRILMHGDILMLGMVFILARGIAKYSGVFIGSAVSKAPANIKKYLGFCMLPQAGVAIGMALIIQASPVITALPPKENGTITMMVNIILLSVFFNELTGPPISKYAIVKAMALEE